MKKNLKRIAIATKKDLTKLALMALASSAVIFANPLSAQENDNQGNGETILAANNDDYRSSGRNRRYDPNQQTADNKLSSGRVSCKGGGKCGQVALSCKSNGKCAGESYHYDDQNIPPMDDEYQQNQNPNGNLRNQNQNPNQNQPNDKNQYNDKNQPNDKKVAYWDRGGCSNTNRRNTNPYDDRNYSDRGGCSTKYNRNVSQTTPQDLNKNPNIKKNVNPNNNDDTDDLDNGQQNNLQQNPPNNLRQNRLSL